MDEMDDFEFDQLLKSAAKSVKLQRLKAASKRLDSDVVCVRSLSFSGRSSHKQPKFESRNKFADQLTHRLEKLEIVQPDTLALLDTKMKVDQFLKALSTLESAENVDPTLVRFFIRDYNRNKVVLAKELFFLFNKYVFDDKLPSNIILQWDGSLRSSAGYWKHSSSSRREMTGADGRILLSKPLLNSPDRLRDTLIHEMCHAATSIITKEKDVHGPFWRCWTMRANLEFPSLPNITRCHNYK